MSHRNALMVGLFVVVLAIAQIPASAARLEAPDTVGLLNGLMAYWTLNEGSGTRYDSSGRGNHLSDVSGVTGVPGKVGDAASFAANGLGYLSRSDNADLSQGDNSFTVAFWVYLDSKPPAVWGSDSATIVNKWGSSNRREYNLIYRSLTVPEYDTLADTFEFSVSADGTDPAGATRASSVSAGAILTHTWYFIVAWHDSVSDTINIQVNNGPVDSDDHTAGVFDSTSLFDLGRNEANQTGSGNPLRLDGRVDELGLWDRVLTPEERTALYNEGNGLSYPFNLLQNRFSLPVVAYNPFPYWVVLKQEDFEGGFPGDWALFASGPSGDFRWGKRGCQPFSGGYSGWAIGGGANGSGLGCGSHYPDNHESWMVYGPFSLTAASYQAELRYKLWLDSEYQYDGLCQLASPDNTQFYGSCATGHSNGWVDRYLNLASVPNLGDLRGDSSVWIALAFLSDEIINYPVGAYVDDILLRKCMDGPCTTATGAQSAPLQPATMEEHPLIITHASP